MAKSVAKNALYSGIRTISFMLFPLITYPYVARVLMAENLGRIDFAVSLVSYFSLIAALGITTYATRRGASLRENRVELEAFASEVFTINIVSTTLAYTLLFLLVLLWPHLHGYAALIAIQSITIIGTTMGVEWIYTLEEDYGYITARTVTVQVISAVLLFTLVHQPSDYMIYALITVISSVGGNVFNWLRSRRYASIRLVWNFDFKQHLLPMLVLFGNAIAITIYVNIDVSLLNVMRGDYEVGLYGMSVKVYRIVKQLLTAIATVALPRLSLYVAQKDDDAYYGLLGNVAHGLLIVVAPALMLLLLMATDVILIVGGEAYLASVPSLRILCAAGLFAVAGNYFVNATLLPFGNEKLVFRSTIMGAIVNLLLNFVFIPLWGMVGAAITTVIAEALVATLAAYFSHQGVKLGKVAKNVSSAVVTAVLGIALMALLYAALQRLPMPWLLAFFVRGAALSLAYLALTLVRKDPVVLNAGRAVLSRVRKPKPTEE